MAGMIRLRPTQIILTGEEVNKTLHKSYPTNSKPQILSVPLQWDHNVTFRKGRSTTITEKSPYFGIHEDRNTNSEADSDECSEMSDFGFGPILLDINPSDTNSVLVEANSSSEAGDDEGSGEDSGKSVNSWDGEYDTSVDTLTNNSAGSDNEALLPSILLGGSNFLRNRQQDAVWEIYSDVPVDHESNGAHDSLNDIEYQADVELSIGDDALSGQDSDAENCAHESYSLPMDGAAERKLGERFASLDLYASPASPVQRGSSYQEKEFPTPGFLGTPSSSTTITPTQPSVRRLLNKISPRLEDAITLSPRHAAVSRAILARYRSDSLKNSTPAKSSSTREGNYHHQRSRTSSQRRFYSIDRNLSPTHAERHSFSGSITTPPNEEHDAGTDDSDGGIQILENGFEASDSAVSQHCEDNTRYSDGVKEDAARKLDG